MNAVHHIRIIDGEVLPVNDGHLVGSRAVGVPCHWHNTTFHAQLVHEFVIVSDGGVVLFLAFVFAVKRAPYHAILTIDDWNAFVDELLLQLVGESGHLRLLTPSSIVRGAADMVATAPVIEHLAPVSILGHAPEVPGIIEVYLYCKLVSDGVFRHLVGQPIACFLGISAGALHH